MANEIRPGDLNSSFFRNNPGKSLKCLLYFLPAFLLLLGLFAVVLPSKLKLDSKNSVVAPVVAEKKGFVGKSNVLLSELLKEENKDVVVRSVADLNKRYPAFEFMLPYDEAEGSNVSDVRLVGVNPDYIEDQELRNFYYNSSMPSLLKKQRSNLSDKYFYIDFSIKYDSRREDVKVTKIYLKPDMFRVALDKDPWKGTIMASPNSLFDDGGSLYLVHKDMVVPMAQVKSLGNMNMSTVIYDIHDEVFLDKKGGTFDYFKYYKDAFGKSPKYLRLDVKKTSKDKSEGWIDIVCRDEDSKRMIQVIPNKNLICRVTAPGAVIETVNPSELAGHSGKTVSYKEGMRILLYNLAGSKIAEFAVVSENPMQVLSTMSYSDEGLGRYYVDSRNADVLTRQMTRGVCRNMSNVMGIDTVWLSVDPLLSLEFENEMKQYIKSLKSSPGFRHMKNEQFEMSMTVMDMATGKILASPSVVDKEDPNGTYAMASRNSSLVRRPIGSTFKPLLTLASVLANPSLMELKNTSAQSRIVDDKYGLFLGCRTKLWVSKHWGNGRNMTQYLAQSDDVYPVLMAALALSGKSDRTNLAALTNLPTGGKSYFSTRGNDIVLGANEAKLSDYEMIGILADLYSVNSFHETDLDEEKNLNYYLWEKLLAGKEKQEGFDMHFGLDEVSPDAMNMRYDRFDDLSLRTHFVPWVLGQGDNDWSCVKMAEAWTRMLSKKAVRASFIAEESNEDSVEDLVEVVAARKSERESAMKASDVNQAWNRFLDAFRQAQSEPGTLNPMHRAVMSLNSKVRPQSDPLLVLSKTGTPDEYKRMETKQLSGNNRYYDVAQFVFSLMPDSSFKSLKNRGDVNGITCVVRITRSYENKADDDGMWSSHARDFLSSNPDRLEKLYHMTRKCYE